MTRKRQGRGEVGGPTLEDMIRHAKDNPYPLLVLRLIGAFFVAGTVKGAAERLGVAEQTAKNMLAQGRRLARVETNQDLVRHYWKALQRNEKILTELGLNDRKLRYHFDEEYRERVRKMARDGMRKKRAASTTWLTQHYDRLLMTQGNACAVCRQPEGTRRNGDGKPVRLSVDHDHVTGAIRELLCSACNLMLGCAKDNPATLEAAAAYLRRHAVATSHKKDLEAA